jgi:citrate lyase beta subunit
MSGDRDAVIAAAEARRAALFADRDAGRPSLPPRWWRQQAHLTVPASDAAMVRKALERGTAPIAHLMAAVGAEARDVAERLKVDLGGVERLLERPRSAPVVMIDLEDGTPGSADGRAASVANAADAFSLEIRSDVSGRPLRFLRPPGLERASGVNELLRVLWDARQPPDAVVLPKVGDADEVGLAIDLLEEAEQSRGLPSGSIRIALLIESAAAVLRLADLAERAGSRLCGLIFGLADFAADLRLPVVALAHPAAEWARTQVVAVAGSRDVPAIDAMTFVFPVADPGGTAASNRAAFLDALATVYADARDAHAAGMSGKLVGHPAQLFVTLLAFEAAVPDDALRVAASSVERYAAARDAGQGAVMIDGHMVDVATDRHARSLLRYAAANGRLDADRAFTLGIIDATERAALSAEKDSER